MTDADLAAYRQAHSQSFFNKATHWIGGAVSSVYNTVIKPVAYYPLEAASCLAYIPYYLGYSMNRRLEKLPGWGQVLTAPLRPIGWVMQGSGLVADVIIDLTKNVVLQNGETWDDEQHPGYLFGSKIGPKLESHGIPNHIDYLPGIGPNSDHRVDFSW